MARAASDPAVQPLTTGRVVWGHLGLPPNALPAPDEHPWGHPGDAGTAEGVPRHGGGVGEVMGTADRVPAENWGVRETWAWETLLSLGRAGPKYPASKQHQTKEALFEKSTFVK